MRAAGVRDDGVCEHIKTPSGKAANRRGTIRRTAFDRAAKSKTAACYFTRLIYFVSIIDAVYRHSKTPSDKAANRRGRTLLYLTSIFFVYRYFS